MSDPISFTVFVHQFLRTLRRHWWQSALLFVACLSLVVGGLLIAPRAYESQGKLFVRFGRGGMTLDPTVTTNETVHIMESREAEVNSVADILESRALIDQVVDTVGVERILKSNFIFADRIKIPDLPSFTSVSVESTAGESNEAYVALKQREKAIRQLSESIKVTPAKKGATINVSCRASSPELAREIVQTLMDKYLDLHISAHRTDESYPFFVEQFDLHQRKVQIATDRVRDFKNVAGITSITGEREAVQSQINQVETDLIATEAVLASAKERTDVIDRQLASLDERLVTEEVEGTTNGAGDLMRDRLYSLEILEKELLTKFNESHPQVQQVKLQVAEARKIADKQPETRTETTTAVNPIRQRVEGDLLQARAELRATEARLAALREKRGVLDKQLDTLNGQEAELSELQRQLDVAQANYTKYADKLEEARISRELDVERVSNVKIVQSASLTLKAVSPKRLILLLLGMVVSFATAIALPQLLELVNRRLRTPEDVQLRLEIPVLVTLNRPASKRLLVS